MPDVAILGAGPAACAAAIELLRGGASVVLIDRGAKTRRVLGETLPPQCKPLLRRLGVWERFQTDGHLPLYANRSAWGESRVRERNLITSPYGHGWRIDRPALDRRLLEAAIAGGAELVRPSTIVAHCRRRGIWSLDLSAGRTQAGRLLDAAGRGAPLARRLGALRSFDDRQTGLLSLGKPRGPVPDDGATLVESLGQGWWFSVIVPDGRLALAYFDDAGSPTLRAARTREGRQQLLARSPHTYERAAAFDLGGPAASVGARSGALERAAGDGWLAVGDAAATHDPLSSHGITAALIGGVEAARAILTDNPRQYAEGVRQRYRENLATRDSYRAVL
jgi:2-polyprenyl-6-methoxyphenol hydroxylase-like FAD-dependent oxidoreductase